MQASQIESLLEQIELRLEALSQALLEGHSAELELHSYGLRQLLEFSARQLPVLALDPGLKWRIRKVSESLQQQRLALIRCCASVERGLSILLPSAELSSNYGGKSAWYSSRSNFQSRRV